MSDLPPPTVAELLLKHGTLVRGLHRRFYSAFAVDSVSEAQAVAAIAAGDAYRHTLDAKGDVFSIRAESCRVVTSAMLGQGHDGQ